MNNGKSSDSIRIRPQQLFYWLTLLVTLIVTSSVVIEYNNFVRSVPIYLFLMIFGIAITAALGMVPGILLALALVSLWIIIKQVTNMWTTDRILFNLLEIVTVAATILMTAFYRRRMQVFISLYTEARNQLKKLDLEDRTVGLIKPMVGMLRLQEEEERSLRYKRPFSLVLIQMQPAVDLKLDRSDRVGLLRALAATIKDTTREVDIPFLASTDKIALILPETGTAGANKVVSNIVKRLIETRFITQKGISAPIRDFARIRFGFATFLGSSNSGIDMMAAAEESMRKSLETNSNELFHNLFIEWTTLGESRISAPIMGDDLDVQTGVRVETLMDQEESAEKPHMEESRPKSPIMRLIEYLRSL